MTSETAYLDALRHQAEQLYAEIHRISLKKLDFCEKAQDTLKKASLDMINVARSLDEARCWELSKK